MQAVLYSWLAAAAVSPFIAILSCWTLAIFRSYRSEWRVLDIFLFALTTLEGVSALFSFGYSILGVIRPALEAPCRFLVWGITATRTFHLSAVTSLLLDRALSTRIGLCSKTYRSSVRHSQVRYHIVVLAIISVFVGVTSVFARLPFSLSCSLHPLDWDLKFSAFLTCVYGLLLITGLVSCFVVQLNRFRSRGTYQTTWSRDSTTSSSGISCAESRDVEWTVAASVCLLSYVINHGPYLVLNSFGMARPAFWSSWMDNSLVWLQLLQGLLVPCVLLMADMPHRSALRNMLRQPGRIYRHLSDHGGFHMQIGDTTSTKPPSFPPFPIYRGPAFPQRLLWSPTNLPSLKSLQPLDVDSLRKGGGYGSGGYTTLLSLPSSTTTTSFSSPYSSCSSSMGQSVDSVTTNAVDDFVFRRPSVLALFDPQPPQPIGSHRQSSEFIGSPSAASAHRQSGGRRCDTPTPFIDEDVDICRCSSPIEDIVHHQDIRDTRSPCSTRDIISKNMINIILAYENGGGQQQSSSEVDDAAKAQQESMEDLSSVTSSESSDADSVQSVIIRQRVDQRGRVSESDITIAQRKVIRCDNESSECESLESSSSERRIVYSEYL